MSRGVEPDPQTWWDDYGHRLEPPAEPVRAVQDHGQDRAPDGAGDPAADLTEDALVRGPDELPPPGWRRWVHWWTGGLVDPGPGRDELARRALLHRIRRPLPAPHRAAVMSIKGGVGKTTVAACLGLTLAEYRGDRIVVLDANPDAGTLAERLTGEAGVTVRELLRDLDRVHSWSDMSRYTSLAGRLQVVASEQDPADVFGRAEYERVSALLGRYFDLTVTDSGTGLVHSAMAGTLTVADSLVVVGSPTVDGAGRAAKTLDWLCAHGHARLAADAVVVLNHDRVSADVDAGRIHAYFAARCRAVVDVPHDPHLTVGGRIDPARLREPTRTAFLRLAALVADGFREGPRAPGAHPAGGPTLEA